MIKKRVLILGSSGLLGSSLAPFFKSEGLVVYTHSGHSKTDFVGDIRDIDFVKNMLVIANPDVIVNLVGLTNVDQCELEPELAEQLNAISVKNIVIALQENTKVHLVHISTDQVYEGEGNHSEENFSLQNIYAQSKYRGELFALEYKKATILRTNFFGKSLSEKKISFSDWLVNSFLEKKEITLFDDVIFSPLSMQSLAKLILLIIEKPKYGVFNLGSHDGMSKKDFAFKLAETLNLNIDNAKIGSIEDVKLEAYRPKNMSMKYDLFENAYSIKLPTLDNEIKSLKETYNV